MTAFAVGAQAGAAQGEGESKPAIDLDSIAKQAAGLITQINSMSTAAEKKLSESAGSSAKDQSCIRDAVDRIRPAAKLAQTNYEELLDFVKDKNADEAEKSWGRVSSYYEAVVSAYGAMQGCGGPTGGSIIDGAPLQQNTNNMTTTTNPTGGTSGTDNLGDLQVSAEQSKSGSQVALEGGN